MSTGRTAARKLWLSRAFYAADLLAGVARGARCPSCRSGRSAPLRPPGRRWSLFLECLGCGLFFRPTGLLGGRVAEFYYSRLYEAGLATSGAASRDAELREHLLSVEGKNRNALVQALFGPPERGEIAVFGCSWGYEVQALQQAGYRAFGIELSDERRGWGTSRLGLTIYPSVAAAAAAGRAPALVLSSHVLEHIPALEAVLDELRGVLRPATQLHITPFVDDFRTNGARATLIGREHPLGVTTHFWQRWCERTRGALRAAQGGQAPATSDWELVASIASG